MRWIYRLERRLGRNFGVANLMMYVTATMLAVYALWLIAVPNLLDWIFFSRFLVLGGQVWRVVTFALIPPVSGNTLLVLLSLYAAYHIGNSLEYAWGKTLFTMYYILGIIGAVIAGFISGVGTNSYVYLSMLLAYCYLYPDATFMIFFLLPVKAKYLAIFNWALYIWAFVQGNFSSRIAIVFSLINFFLFFGPDIWKTVRSNYNAGRRRREYRKNWGDNNPWR